MKFKKGDRVVVVGNQSHDAPAYGTTGTVKRYVDLDPGRASLVVEFDGGFGWSDYQEPGMGWNIHEVDLGFADDLQYEIDE